MHLQSISFKFSKIFFSILSASFVSAVILYYSLKKVYGYSPFACPIAWRCWPYWDTYPIPYLIALSSSYSFFCSLWILVFSGKSNKLQLLQFVVVPILALLLGGYLSGIIWAYQDMQAGYFPPFSQALEYTRGLAVSGLFLSITTALASFPLNVLALLITFIISFGTKKIMKQG
jgi:hypothetical protein